MIIGVDHISFSCNNVDEISEKFKFMGFREMFRECGIPNEPRKRSLLREYYATHSIVYCKPEKGVAIELTDYGRDIDGDDRSPYGVSFADGGCQALCCHRITYTPHAIFGARL